MSSSKYGGEHEEPAKFVLSGNESDLVCTWDALHHGRGMDSANLLKPMLVRSKS